jgi:hypothetical protein
MWKSYRFTANSFFFSNQQQKNFNWFNRLSFFLVLFSDVTYQVAKKARCTTQKYSAGIRGSILMAKKAGHEAEHLPPSNVKVKNEWS